MARWRSGPLTVLLALLLAGCALPQEPVDDAQGATTAGVTSAPETTGSPTSGPATETARTPETESSDTGNGTLARVDQPVVTVPQLPIGGGGQNGDFEQCVSVSYRGGDDDPVPERARLTLEGASFTPPLLELGGSACSGDVTECLSGGFAFTAANTGTEAGTCFVAVRGTGERPGTDLGSLVFENVDLRMHGRALCPDGEKATCQAFAAGLPQQPDSINLEIAVIGPTTSSSASSESSSASESTAESTSASADETTPSDGGETPPD